jgi:hypothetical protein
MKAKVIAAEHTPGPWERRLVDGVSVSVENRIQDDQSNADELSPNARMIAAAPELAGACEWLLREYCSHLQGNGYAKEIIADLPHVKAAYAALKKAGVK